MNTVSRNSYVLWYFLTICVSLATSQRSSIKNNRQIRHREHEIREEDIIELPIGRFPEPLCEYSVHLNDRTGAPVRNAVPIGHPLYHKWRCFYPGYSLNLYCMVVHNCTVSNGAISEKIIDEFGCSLFPDMIPHISYANDLEGGIKSNAFSLTIDQPAVYFNCGIKLLIKDKGVCRRPRCIPREWFRRATYRRRSRQ